MIPPRFGSVFPASCASTLYTILSQWWFISTLQCGQIILSVLATTAILVSGHQSRDICSRPTERSGRDPHYANSFMDVFLETTVQNMLQETGVAVVVLRRHDHQRVRL